MEAHNDHHDHEESFVQILKNTLHLIFTPKMVKVNMQLVFTGISIAYWSGILTPIIIFQLDNDPNYADLDLEENEKDQYALIIMIAFGFGEVFGAFFMGWFIDTFNPKRGAVMNMGIIIVMTLITLISISIEKFNWLSFVMSFFWGIQDGMVNIHTLQTLGFEFTSHSEPFGVFNLFNGLSVFIF